MTFGVILKESQEPPSFFSLHPLNRSGSIQVDVERW